jgi:hypothetical protein
MYLCHACSCHALEDGIAPGQALSNGCEACRSDLGLYNPDGRACRRCRPGTRPAAPIAARHCIGCAADGPRHYSSRGLYRDRRRGCRAHDSAACAAADLSRNDTSHAPDAPPEACEASAAAACAAVPLGTPGAGAACAGAGAGGCSYTARVVEVAEACVATSSLGCAAADMSGPPLVLAPQRCTAAGTVFQLAAPGGGSSFELGCVYTPGNASAGTPPTCTSKAALDCAAVPVAGLGARRARDEAACSAAGVVPGVCRYVAYVTPVAEACDATDAAACAGADIGGAAPNLTAHERSCQAAGACTYWASSRTRCTAAGACAYTAPRAPRAGLCACAPAGSCSAPARARCANASNATSCRVAAGGCAWTEPVAAVAEACAAADEGRCAAANVRGAPARYAVQRANASDPASALVLGAEGAEAEAQACAAAGRCHYGDLGPCALDGARWPCTAATAVRDCVDGAGMTEITLRVHPSDCRF